MYKKTITYEDFDGNERTEDFYFNLTPQECTEKQLSTKGGLDNYITKIINAKDTPEIIKQFKEIIDISYGCKTPDGRNFKKSEEILNDFKSTNAYSMLYMELGTDDVAAAEFINNVLPKKNDAIVPQDHKIAEIKK